MQTVAYTTDHAKLCHRSLVQLLANTHHIFAEIPRSPKQRVLIIFSKVFVYEFGNFALQEALRTQCRLHYLVRYCNIQTLFAYHVYVFTGKSFYYCEISTDYVSMTVVKA